MRRPQHPPLLLPLSPSGKASLIPGNTQVSSCRFRPGSHPSLGSRRGSPLPSTWGGCLEPQVHLLSMGYLPWASAARSNPNQFLLLGHSHVQGEASQAQSEIWGTAHLLNPTPTPTCPWHLLTRDSGSLLLTCFGPCCSLWHMRDLREQKSDPHARLPGFL